jgi:hypothetical protein
MIDPQHLAEQLAHDPFVVRYIERSRLKAPNGGQPRIHSAAQVIGEQRAFALSLAVSEKALRAKQPELAHKRSAVPDLLAATPYLWLDEIGRAARDLPIPRHIVADHLLPHPLCWWTFEAALPIVAEGQTVALMDGLLLGEMAGGVQLGALGQMGTLDEPGVWGTLASDVIRYGQRWPDDFAPAQRSMVGSVLAMLAFLASPFVAVNAERPHTTKAARRKAPRQAPAVRFVRLRGAISDSGHAPDSGEHRAWQVRWIVRGHVRAQWYPSQRAHRLIWISAHQKGPADAPLKRPAYVVVR